MEKVCTGCGAEKPADARHFYVRRRRGRVDFTPRCRDCIKTERRAYRAANPEKMLEVLRRSYAKHGAKYNATRNAKLRADPVARAKRSAATKIWIAENQDKVIASRVARYAENKPEILEAARAYHRANPDKLRENHRRRRARVRGAEGSFSDADFAKIRAAQDERCYWCETALGDDAHPDHYVPLARGGSNWPENIVAACPSCNLSRQDKMPDEFRAYLKVVASMADEIAVKRATHASYMRDYRRKNLAA